LTLQLRHTTRGDLDFVLSAERDRDAAPFIVRWDRARHEQAIAEADEEHLLILDGARALGFVLLAGVAAGHSIELRRIVVVERNRGLGRLALGLVLEHSFRTLGAHRVWLDVMIDNARARRAYSAAGFVLEGVLRDALRTADGYRSLAVMSVLRTEWPA
jgi:diamine N-acetyltransferase